eukprot:gene8556-biopygen2700
MVPRIAVAGCIVLRSLLDPIYWEEKMVTLSPNITVLFIMWLSSPSYIPSPSSCAIAPLLHFCLSSISPVGEMAEGAVPSHLSTRLSLGRTGLMLIYINNLSFPGQGVGIMCTLWCHCTPEGVSAFWRGIEPGNVPWLLFVSIPPTGGPHGSLHAILDPQLAPAQGSSLDTAVAHCYRCMGQTGARPMHLYARLLANPPLAQDFESSVNM